MARRLILDGVLVASERGRAGLRALINPDDDLVIAAVTVAELCTGVELSGELQPARRHEFLRHVLEALPVEPYDVATAQAHGGLLAHAHRAGTTREAHDLIVAATAVATGRIILTTDRRARFGDLPGVECIVGP